MRQTMLRWTRRLLEDERGSVFLIVGTFLVLLLFVGMATDFGIILRYRRAMQNGCDSSVLAGAQDLQTNRSATTTAQTYAQRDLTQNNIIWNANNFTATTEDANGNATGIKPVRLAATYRATVPLFFLASVAPSMTISVQCAAQRVPVLTTGLKPLGLDAAVYTARWAAQGNQPCPLFGASGNPRTFGSLPCGDCALSVPVNGHTGPGTAPCDSVAGGGNTGALRMFNPQAGCTTNGDSPSSGWPCTFENGTGTGSGGATPPPPYCATTSTSTNPADWPACATVSTKPGMAVGPWKGAVTNSAVCGSPDPVTNPHASGWVVIMPLMGHALWGGNGTFTDDIVGFAAFELDCPYMASINQYEPIIGTFVSILDFQGTIGNPNGTDTGVETIILVQ